MLSLIKFLLAATLASLSGTAMARDVSIGVFAYQGESAASADWAAVLDYLNAAVPEHRFRLDHHDAAGLRKAIADRRVDLVITNPGYYITMEGEFGLSRIATLQSPQGAPERAIGSTVFARANRPELRELSDLSGKKVAAVAPEALGGYLAAAREMLKQGIDAESDLKELRFVGLPMSRVVDAVQRGEADAGIVRACELEQMAGRGELSLENVRILSPRRADGFACTLSTRLYPDWPIAVTRGTDAALAKSVARALLAMPERAGTMSWTVPADYQPVHELYRELRVGPYASLRDVTPAGLAKRFWPWIAGVMLLLVAWIVHTVRVETLVHRRAAQLQESMQAQQRAEKRITESQEQMEHLSRLSVLGELSGTLAHELNQPLTTIATYARSVLRRQSAGTLTPEAVTEACTEMANEAERAGGIVQRIRHFARKRGAARNPVDLAAVAREASRMIDGMLARAPHIAIEDRRIEDRRVMADAPQIQQVLLNLIKNAIDACRDLPAERRDIEVAIESAGKNQQVHVIDQGVGLDAALRERLFEPFFTTKPDGMGLGLPICKTIIEAHGGRLWAQPNPDGRGMRFSFSLPCHELPA